MTAFDLSALTPAQRGVVEGAIARCEYDFGRCLPTLRAQWGKHSIDVAFSDLSRYAATTRGMGDDHDHEFGHVHVTDPEGREGVEAHGIEVRHRVLGLAWSNGKIELDSSLETEVELAHEVFLSEVAHEVDWFDPAMDSAGEERIWDAMHDGTDDIGDHGHDWFDVGPYESWAGEGFMGVFTAATSDVRVSLTQFAHKATPRAIAATRELLGIGTAPVPEEPPPIVPPLPPVEDLTYFGGKRSPVFHDSHEGIRADLRWALREHAIAAGRRPCGVCRP